MEVTPTREQQAFIRDAIASGRLHGPEEALREALSLWEERERRRAEILAAVESAEASLARGDGRTVSSHEETAQFAADIKRRGMARLTADPNERG
jgi:Arc/MetJ-type ribon-helix-helix transcriptional regulator